MKRHAYVFLAYLHPDIVKNAFDSICDHPDIDFYIIENPSEGTPQIEEYFLSKKDKIKRYIRFDENIVLNAFTLYLRENIKIFEEYEYLTVTDGDIYVYDIVDAIKEIYYMLEIPKIMVASCSAFIGNYFEDYGSYKVANRVFGIDNFITNFASLRRDMPYGVGGEPGVGRITRQGGFLGTVKRENMDLFTVPDVCADTYIEQLAWKRDGCWARTLKNVCYHLRWDLYVPGNPYYEARIRDWNIPYHHYPDSSYQVIL